VACAPVLFIVQEVAQDDTHDGARVTAASR